uniref:Uncharacterized protein n=1 Tax=Rhizophora mucronata TaxID=61149 RepID=A0A2P2NT61_RHIMU
MPEGTMVVQFLEVGANQILMFAIFSKFFWMKESHMIVHFKL